MKIKMIVASVLVLAVLMAAGCSAKTTSTPEPTKPSSPTAESKPTALPQPTAASSDAGDATAVLLEAAQAVKNRSYRATTQSVKADSTDTSVSTVEFVPPDKYHVINPSMEIIISGSDTYMKVGDQWTVSPIDLSGLLKSLEGIQDDAMSGITNLKEEANDTLDGKAARVFSYDLNTAVSGTQVASSNRIWISQADNLPLKIESLSETDGVKTTTTVLYDYDPNLKIEVPTVQ
jgi:hypothetical protein